MIPVGRMRSVAALCAAGSVAATGALMLSPWRADVAMPGPLSSNHASLAADCGACHAQSRRAVQAISHGLGVTALDARQTELCIACHAIPAATGPHGWSYAEHPVADAGTRPLAGGGENTQCATCHREHRGRSSDLKALDDGRCQVCHSEPFDGFANHPAFVSYPQREKTNLGLDHVSHLLRHFPEDRDGRAPEACTSCHALDPSGRHMPVRSYAETCSACHDADITGPGQVTGAGLAVLSLPALDTTSLAERGFGIGRWPADSRITEAPITPFLALLLSSDEELENDLDTLEGVDLLDLSGVEDEAFAAVVRLAWGVKELYANLARRGHAAVLERVPPVGVDAPAPPAPDLLHRLPEDLVQRALDSWLPDLEGELARRAAGAEVPTDASPPDAEPDLDRDARHERWVETGGWFLSELDFVIRYRPAGHADGFLRSWIDLSGGIGRRGRSLFDALTSPDAAGRCVKCHAVTTIGAGSVPSWEGAKGGFGRSGLDRFSHVAHFASPSDNACLACHVLERGARADFVAAFLAHDRGAFVPSFLPMTTQTCAECHGEESADADCLTCHVYHVRRGEARLPSASLEAIR